MTETIQKPLSGKTVFFMFAAFFVLVASVNAVFITIALDSHSGVVNEEYYKTGLNYNAVLEKAKNQPKLNSAVNFEEGVLSWHLVHLDGSPLENAQVTAKFYRPVKAGQDFDGTLTERGRGLYSMKPDFPVKGSWKVHLDAQWDNKRYQASQNLIIE